MIISKLINFIDNLWLNFKSFYCSLFFRLYLKCINVEFSTGLKLYGFPKFKKATLAIIKIGKNVTLRSSPTSNLIGINRPCIVSALTPVAKIKIGDNCGLSGTVIGAFSEIILEDNVRCGANTLITDSDWHLDDPRVGESLPIKLCNNVWLGEDVKVLKGVTIGKNSVIGAGSIVTKNIPSNVIAAGNPCKVLKKIEKN